MYAPGKNFKEKLNNWHKDNKMAVSSNFVGIPRINAMAEFVWTKADDEELPQVTQRDIEELEILESLVTSTQNKIDNTRQKIGGQAKKTWD